MRVDYYNTLNVSVSLSLQLKIAMVGKYTGLSDSYLSVIKVGILTERSLPISRPFLVVCL